VGKSEGKIEDLCVNCRIILEACLKEIYWCVCVCGVCVCVCVCGVCVVCVCVVCVCVEWVVISECGQI